MDIKTAAEKLELPIPRKLYDITAVLEGAGLVKKLPFNQIRWKDPILDIDKAVTKIISLEQVARAVSMLKEKVFHLDHSLKFAQNQFEISEPRWNYQWLRTEPKCFKF